MPTPPHDETDHGDAEIRSRAKRELRKRMRALRAAIPESARALRSHAICRAVLDMPEWSAARTVALFVPMDEEVQTGPLIDAARAAGQRVALPVVTDAPVLLFRAAFEGPQPARWTTSAFGVSEPTDDHPTVAPGEIDLVLVPALAVDANGHRIGYGGGFYDRTLPTLASAFRVVVAFDFQLIAEVPTHAFDAASNAVATDRHLYRTGPNPSRTSVRPAP